MVRLIVGAAFIALWLLMSLSVLFMEGEVGAKIMSGVLASTGLLGVPGTYLLLSWRRHLQGGRPSGPFRAGAIVVAVACLALGIRLNPGARPDRAQWRPGQAILEVALTGDVLSVTVEDVARDTVQLGTLGPLRSRTKQFTIAPGFHELRVRAAGGNRTAELYAPADSVVRLEIWLKNLSSRRQGLRTTVTTWAMDLKVIDPVPVDTLGRSPAPD